MAFQHKIRKAIKHSKDLPSSLKNRRKYAEHLQCEIESRIFR